MFMDPIRAFDKVNCCKLWTILKRGAPFHLIEVFQCIEI